MEGGIGPGQDGTVRDRKSTRLNSSHLGISYAVFCLKKNNSRSLKNVQFVAADGSSPAFLRVNFRKGSTTMFVSTTYTLAMAGAGTRISLQIEPHAELLVSHDVRFSEHFNPEFGG